MDEKTKRECVQALHHMRRAADMFFRLSLASEVPAFVGMVEPMHQFITQCEQALARGEDFRQWLTAP